MKNTLCFECENPATVEHHVIPRSKGGTKTVPLCDSCHSLIHDANLVTTAGLSRDGKKKNNSLLLAFKILKLHENGIGKSEMARLLCISRDAVYGILEKLEVHKNTGTGWGFKVTSKMLEDALELRKQKKSWDYILEKVGISKTHLYRFIEPDNLYCCESNRNRKNYVTFTSKKIKEAKELREQNLTWQQIADRLDVDRITLIRSGITKEFTHLRGSLTEEKKELAIKWKRDGKTWKEIADFLGVSKGAIFYRKIHKLV